MKTSPNTKLSFTISGRNKDVFLDYIGTEVLSFVEDNKGKIPYDVTDATNDKRKVFLSSGGDPHMSEHIAVFSGKRYIAGSSFVHPPDGITGRNTITCSMENLKEVGDNASESKMVDGAKVFDYAEFVFESQMEDFVPDPIIDRILDSALGKLWS